MLDITLTVFMILVVSMAIYVFRTEVLAAKAIREKVNYPVALLKSAILLILGTASAAYIAYLYHCYN